MNRREVTKPWCFTVKVLSDLLPAIRHHISSQQCVKVRPDCSFGQFKQTVRLKFCIPSQVEIQLYCNDESQVFNFLFAFIVSVIKTFRLLIVIEGSFGIVFFMFYNLSLSLFSIARHDFN
jgi:hypothetical protein